MWGVMLSFLILAVRGVSSGRVVLLIPCRSSSVAVHVHRGLEPMWQEGGDLALVDARACEKILQARAAHAMLVCPGRDCITCMVGGASSNRRCTAYKHD